MKQITLFTQHALMNDKDFTESALILQPEIARIKDALGTEYTTRYASINAPSDVRIFEAVQRLAAEKESLDPSIIVLIGIGGSNLGTLAILEALYGEHYHYATKRTFYCADTVDSYKIYEIKEAVESACARGEHVLLIIVSKSGSTVETISNSAVLIKVLQHYNPQEYHHSVVAITEHGSSLWYIAEAAHWSVLEIPMLVGGRYSVFTAAGLFPLAMMGVDINALQEGAHFMGERCVSDDIAHNPAAASAIFLYHYYQKSLRIHDTFIFSPRLAGVGTWYRQLLAESIGKKRNDGTAVGLTPTVTIGSTDLHSMAQLYLGGPRDRCTTFVWVASANAQVKVPSGPLTDAKSPQPFLKNKTFHGIMKAIFDGTQTAYEEHALPFVTFHLPDLQPHTIAAFMQMKMMEIMYLAYLLEVNPFDQPDVESYKTITQELLAEHEE